MDYKFVADDFKAPFEVVTDNYKLRKLTVDEVEKDYKAVMSSKESLRQIFAENDDWPSDDMTIEENYNDLLEHQEEFDSNQGFTYTIVTPDDAECIGCLYIYPFKHGLYDCRVFYWFVDAVDSEMNPHLRGFIDQWMPETFGLKKPAYPGRDLSHKEWTLTVQRIKEGKMT